MQQGFIHIYNDQQMSLYAGGYVIAASSAKALFAFTIDAKAKKTAKIIIRTLLRYR